MEDFGLKVGRHSTALPTLVDGEVNELQVDVNGRLLVQADVSVLVDFLGLNGASDNANILIVGTEDGTAVGTAHAVRLAADGSVAVQDNGGSLTVDAVNLDIRDLVFATDKVDVSGSDITATVTATDLDIRDLEFATDKVDVSGSAVTAVVTATDLDIRDLAFATDKVDVTGSEVSLDAATLAALENITVSATDLDIRNLVFATDKVDVTGSAVTAVVTATDLDIRNLSATQDNVAISDGTDTLAVNADGSINSVVTATDLDIRNLAFATDKVDVSGSTVVASITPAGSEVYAITDNQAAAGDGEYAITDTFSNAFTPIVVGIGQTLHVYGWQWCADKNAQARIVVIDGLNTSVVKNSLNSTAQPSIDSHFADAGRIEIAGGAAVTVVVQMKARQAGGTANASASLHCRIV